MSAHTPGPWQVEARRGETLICRSDSAVLARLAAAKEWRANARLIAAAPELLEALEDCAERLAIHMRHTEDLMAHMRAHKAIAKARGQA